MILESQLLNLIRNAVSNAGKTDSETERKNLLENAELLLNELLLRNENTFYIDYFDQGKQLLQEGLTLVGGQTGDAEQIIASAIAESSSSDQVAQQIDGLRSALHGIVSALPGAVDGQVNDYLDRLNTWEVEAYAHRLQDTPKPSATATGSQVSREAFEAYLSQRQPEWKGLKITNFTVIGGGFSKNTVLIDLEDDVNGSHSLAVRMQPDENILELHAINVQDEYPLVKLAHDKGIIVAEPLWLETDTRYFGGPFMVSRRASGINLGDATGARSDITVPMVKALAEQTAKLHSIDLSAERRRFENTVLEQSASISTVEEATRQYIQFWRDISERAGIAKSPLVERAFRWLEENVAHCEDGPVLVHGDIGMHNVLFDDDELTAILDWEASHIGDPADELAWIIQCTGQYLDGEKLLELYQDAGGRPLSEFRLRYFDVFMCIKMPIACLAAEKILHTRPGSPQLAVFALRFIHSNASRLAEAIRIAEQAKNNAR